MNDCFGLRTLEDIGDGHRCHRTSVQLRKMRTNSSSGESAEFNFQTNRYFAFTLDVIEVITLDAILNWSFRFSIPCRCAIQSKSV